MTFDESNAKLTECLTGRTIEYVFRQGKYLLLHTTCGHEIKLQADVNGEIHFVSMGVKIILPGVSMLGEASEFPR